MSSADDSSGVALALRVGAAGLLAGLILASTSYLINVLWLGSAHEALDIFRPEEDPRVVPGLLFSAIAWGSLLAAGYRVFWRRPVQRPGWLEGARYGLLVCSFFTLIQSVFIYQLVRLSGVLLLGDVLHYLLASTLAGAVIGVIVPARGPEAHSRSPT